MHAYHVHGGSVHSFPVQMPVRSSSVISVCSALDASPPSVLPVSYQLSPSDEHCAKRVGEMPSSSINLVVAIVLVMLEYCIES